MRSHSFGLPVRIAAMAQYVKNRILFCLSFSYCHIRLHTVRCVCSWNCHNISSFSFCRQRENSTTHSIHEMIFTIRLRPLRVSTVSHLYLVAPTQTLPLAAVGVSVCERVALARSPWIGAVRYVRFGRWATVFVSVCVCLRISPRLFFTVLNRLVHVHIHRYGDTSASRIKRNATAVVTKKYK